MSYELIIGKKKSLSDYFTSHFGCVNCEWRGGPMCKYDVFTKGGCPEGMFCQERKDWLSALLPPYDKSPTIAQIHLDLNKALGDTHMLKAKRIVDMYEEMINDLDVNDDDYDKKLRGLEQKRFLSVKEFESFWKTSTFFHDKQVDRETPKQLDVKIESSMDRLRSTIIDAEVIDDDKKN